MKYIVVNLYQNLIMKQFTQFLIKIPKYLSLIQNRSRCMQNVLYKYNLQYVKTLDLAFQSSIDFGQWNDAKEFGFELIDGYKMYYGDVHPLLELLYLKLGKILVFQEKNREAMTYLKLAYDNLKITHGQTSQLFRFELMPLLQQAKAEIDLN